MGSEELSFRKAVWLLAVAYTLHNLEEFLWQPGWSGDLAFQPDIHPFAFRLAVLVVIAGAWLIAAFAARARAGAVAAHAAAAAAGILFLNAFFPHLLTAVWVGGYAPGVVTAVALNLWVGPLVLRAALREGMVTRRGAILSTALACALVLPALAAFFWLGGLWVGEANPRP